MGRCHPVIKLWLSQANAPFNYTEIMDQSVISNMVSNICRISDQRLTKGANVRDVEVVSFSKHFLPCFGKYRYESAKVLFQRQILNTFAMYFLGFGRYLLKIN